MRGVGRRAGEQVLFVLEVVVEHTVGDLGFPRDVADSQPCAAPLIDQPRGGRDQVLAQVRAVAVAQHGGFPR